MFQQDIIQQEDGRQLLCVYNDRFNKVHTKIYKRNGRLYSETGDSIQPDHFILCWSEDDWDDPATAFA